MLDGMMSDVHDCLGRWLSVAYVYFLVAFALAKKHTILGDDQEGL
jgi:hypothetical protein